jgi:hypothetical protein
METEDKSLLVFSVLGLLSAVYWSIYVFYPSNPVIIRLSLALNGAWMAGYALVILTIIFGGVHLWHRKNN